MVGHGNFTSSTIAFYQNSISFKSLYKKVIWIYEIFPGSFLDNLEWPFFLKLWWQKKNFFLQIFNQGLFLPTPPFKKGEGEGFRTMTMEDAKCDMEIILAWVVLAIKWITESWCIFSRPESWWIFPRPVIFGTNVYDQLSQF